MPRCQRGDQLYCPGNKCREFVMGEENKRKSLQGSFPFRPYMYIHKIISCFLCFLFSMQFSFVILAKKNSEGDIEGQMGLMELNKKQASQDQTYAHCRSNASFDRTLPPCSPTHTTNTRKEAFSLLPLHSCILPRDFIQVTRRQQIKTIPDDTRQVRPNVDQNQRSLFPA